MKIRNPRQVINRGLFDFANSGFSAVISVVIFSVYFMSAIVGGITGQGDLWWGRANSLSMTHVNGGVPNIKQTADFIS